MNGNPNEFSSCGNGVPPDPTTATTFQQRPSQPFFNTQLPNGFAAMPYANMAATSSGSTPTTSIAAMNPAVPFLPTTNNNPYDYYMSQNGQRSSPADEWKSQSAEFDFTLNSNSNLDMAAAANSFYNQFVNDGYADQFAASTSLMTPYYGSYYGGAGPFAAAASCVDFMQNPTMINQWRLQSKSKQCSAPRSSSLVQPTNLGHQVGAGTNNVRVRTTDKYRTVYTDQQRLALEQEFCSSQFVTTEQKTRLATDLKLTERQVKIWYQNRRAKERRQKSNGSIRLMRVHE
ncbi:Homeobox protein pal-1 [Aphelenchoides besseyi]|nr:Homeobox protein pal-1 [Aphelenchoides besseyi]KAI6202537.1 Homeobox protein pal-1 [Aphelenchoides besseyi]